MIVKVNDHVPLTLPQTLQQRKHPFRGPVDITDFCREHVDNTLCISLEQSLPQGASSDPLPNECAVSIIHVYKNTVSKSIDMLQRLPKYTRRAEETRSLIKKQFAGDDACGVTEVNIPLTCPVRLDSFLASVLISDGTS
jgi:hypothetical protein